MRLLHTTASVGLIIEVGLDVCNTLPTIYTLASSMKRATCQFLCVDFFFLNFYLSCGNGYQACCRLAKLQLRAPCLSLKSSSRVLG